MSLKKGDVVNVSVSAADVRRFSYYAEMSGKHTIVEVMECFKLARLDNGYWIPQDRCTIILNEEVNDNEI